MRIFSKHLGAMKDSVFMTYFLDTGTLIWAFHCSENRRNRRTNSYMLGLHQHDIPYELSCKQCWRYQSLFSVPLLFLSLYQSDLHTQTHRFTQTYKNSNVYWITHYMRRCITTIIPTSFIALSPSPYLYHTCTHTHTHINRERDTHTRARARKCVYVSIYL